MEYSKFTYQELFKLANQNKLILPNFQRDFVWKPDGQKELLASFLVNLPVGAFLILEGEGNEFASKELCFIKRRVEFSNRDCYYLLDGQQRLSTLKNIFSDHLGLDTHNWKVNYQDLHYQLQTKWFIKLDFVDNEDIFGLEKLNFKVPHTSARGKKSFIPKPLTLEPTDVLSSILFYRVNKTKKDKFYHPDADLGAGSSYDKKLKLALKCAEKSLIPLFDLLTDSKIIFKNALKHIANSRLESLKEKVRKDVDKYASDYLGHLDSDIVNKYHSFRMDEVEIRWDSLKEQWVEDISDYFRDLFRAEIMIPTVKSNELARATSVFEFMNKGGTPLDTFDIMVAKYAGVGSIKTLYDKLHEALVNITPIKRILSESGRDNVDYSPEHFEIFKKDILIKPVKEQFLNILSLIHKIKKDGFLKTSINDIKKQKILSLKQADIDSSVDEAIKGLYRALAFLQFRCGLDNFNRLSYKLMLIPIAVILCKDENWLDKKIIDRLEFWYWSSLFSGRYREKQNQRIIDDLHELCKWLIANQQSEIIKRKDTVFEETNYCNEETLLLKSEDKSVPTAIYNGILQYILSQKPNDFVKESQKLRAWEVSYNKIHLEDHHIVPLGSVTTLGQSSTELRKNKKHILNSPLNRTLISRSANNKIKAMSLDKYLPVLNQSVGYSHCIHNPPKDISAVKEGNYEQFLRNRFSSIKNALQRELDALIE
ncbi:MAG: DUF262 domain-containing protein [Aureispira sp.]